MYDKLIEDIERCRRDYDGDMKRMLMDARLNEIHPRLDNELYDEEQLSNLSNAGESNLNPLSQYSTSELKRELRRRKGKK